MSVEYKRKDNVKCVSGFVDFHSSTFCPTRPLNPEITSLEESKQPKIPYLVKKTRLFHTLDRRSRCKFFEERSAGGKC